jgi:hypothetical protein
MVNNYRETADDTSEIMDAKTKPLTAEFAEKIPQRTPGKPFNHF